MNILLLLCIALYKKQMNEMINTNDGVNKKISHHINMTEDENFLKKFKKPQYKNLFINIKRM